ncbi:MAG TPA: class I SAM-dependent methyltransferase [Burkholderiaceae bacterium]|jgi:SAM-dependent methyltransferase|nr:class I SAM-dependent methyltransferase [Burkholderiaceae bacterium]
MNAGLLAARELLRIVGPGRIGLIGAEPELARELAMAGCVLLSCDDGCATDVDTVVIDAGAIAQHARDPDVLFGQLYRARCRFVALLAGAGRGELAHLGSRALTTYWTNAAIGAGFRRCVAAVRTGDYAAANDPLLPPLLAFERVDEPEAARWPMSWLLANRDLHMDMTREAGPRADAHLVRYALAAQWVRPGDTVLDCACGLGYGTALLAAQSRGKRFIGVDVDAESVAYAAAHFGHRYGAEFHVADGTHLEFLPAASVDFIVSFETIEHVPDYERLLAEFSRVLKPDGRIMASVPNLWVDETGRDPNPHHHHAFDWSRLAAAFQGRFLIEKRYRQEAPGGFKLTQAPRNLQEWPLQREPEDTEWWLIVAAADPRRPGATTYSHPDFSSAVRIGAQVVDFGRWYDNPWLYRPLVQMGERLSDAAQLRALALDVLAAAADDSADFGAAATVLAYSLLSDERRNEFAGDILAIAESYTAKASANPHVHRWQISLGYVAGLLALSTGQRAMAARWFEVVAARDPLTFSPLLATKTVAAGFWRAILALVDGDRDGAVAMLRRAIECARAALHADDRNVIGAPDDPLSFGFAELAEVADMASQCALALRHIDEFRRAPGKFWALIDVRRFGLSSWAQNLERENRELMQWLTQLRSMVVAAQPASGRVSTALAA